MKEYKTILKIYDNADDIKSLSAEITDELINKIKTGKITFLAKSLLMIYYYDHRFHVLNILF